MWDFWGMVGVFTVTLVCAAWRVGDLKAKLRAMTAKAEAHKTKGEALQEDVEHLRVIAAIKDGNRSNGATCNLCGGPTCRACNAFFTGDRDDGFCSDGCAEKGEAPPRALGMWGD